MIVCHLCSVAWLSAMPWLREQHGSHSPASAAVTAKIQLGRTLENRRENAHCLHVVAS